MTEKEKEQFALDLAAAMCEVTYATGADSSRVLDEESEEKQLMLLHGMTTEEIHETAEKMRSRYPQATW